MLDVVYICRDGDNEELRYSIRSVVQNLPHRKIWIVGGKPRWYQGNYIPVKQNGTKFQNARANINAIVNSDEISDDFVLMNDDFFIMSPIDRVKDYYCGHLDQKIQYFINKHPKSKYTDLLMRSMKTLKRSGIANPIDYTLHIPMNMNKQKLKKVLSLSISWRLAYGNIHRIQAEYVSLPPNAARDVKIYIENNKLTDVSSNPLSEIYLSTEDRAFLRMKKFFMTRFPNKTIYEKF